MKKASKMVGRYKIGTKEKVNIAASYQTLKEKRNTRIINSGSKRGFNSQTWPCVS